MSGLMGGSSKRASPSGHLRVPGRCAERCHHDGLVGTQPVGHLEPRQLPTRHGRFYGSWLSRSLARINDYLVRWAQRKYKRLNNHPSRSWRWLEGVARRSPALFAHWHIGVLP